MIEQALPVRPGELIPPRSRAAPHPALRRSVRGYAGFAGPRGAQVVLPATAAVGLIVKIEDSAHRPPAFLMGAHGRHVVLDGACAPAYVQVFLRPLAAYTIVGMPVSELAGQAVDLLDVVGRVGAPVLERLRAEATWPRRFALLDQLLLDRRSAGPRPAPEVRRAYQLLDSTAGAMPVGRVADEVGWSHKRLAARFTQQIGLPPKAAARLLRFDRVLRALDAADRPPWTRIAVEAGYTDQSHLIRDFHVVTGAPPTAFLAMVSGSPPAPDAG
jgi:AraC-like DNA-binding protein